MIASRTTTVPLIGDSLRPNIERDWFARRNLTFLLVFFFLALRVITSGPATTLVQTTEGGPMLGIQSSIAQPVITALGLLLSVAILALDPLIGFAIIICDMNGFGNFFDLDQWGLTGLFKFRDVELVVLLIAGPLMASHSQANRYAVSEFGRWLRRIAVGFAGLGIVYTLATLYVQDIGTTVRYSRQLYVWLLLLVAPQFIRSPRDLRRAMVIFVGWAGLAASLYVAQSMLPVQTVLRYSQQSVYGYQTRVWSSALSPVFLGGLVIFAYQLIRRRTSVLVWVLFALCGVAVVSSQGRVLTFSFIASVLALTSYQAFKTRKFSTLLRFGAISTLVTAIGAAILIALGRLDPLVNSWILRFGELDSDLNLNQGSLSSRLEMLYLVPDVVRHNGGDYLNMIFGMGLRALTPSQLSPLVFWGSISPAIWADNGIAGVMFTTGYVGLGLLLMVIVLILRRIRKELSHSNDPIARSCLMAAFVYFLFALPYMLFSSHFLGSWDEAMVISVVLILAERALSFEQLQHKNGREEIPESTRSRRISLPAHRSFGIQP